MALKKLKNNKRPGTDGFTSEYFWSFGNNLDILL